MDSGVVAWVRSPPNFVMIFSRSGTTGGAAYPPQSRYVQFLCFLHVLLATLCIIRLDFKPFQDILINFFAPTLQLDLDSTRRTKQKYSPVTG